MNYQRIYDNLIVYRKVNEPKGYTEKHHIQMRSLGGSNEESNLVKLTGREHFIAHLLLHKILRCSESAYALWMMQCKSSCNDKRPAIKSSRMYEWARKEFAKYISRNNQISAKGSNNSQFGTRWICNIDLKKNEKISTNDELPHGWILGRNKWKCKIHPRTLANLSRVRLKKQISITNGSENKQLHFEDQLPIPSGWKIGKVKLGSLVQSGEH